MKRFNIAKGNSINKVMNHLQARFRFVQKFDGRQMRFLLIIHQ